MKQLLPKPSVLAIYIPKQGLIRQGKFCLIDEKPCFIANMTPQKEWRNFSGYSISIRLLEALPRGTKIIYKRVDLNQYYITNRNTFHKRGVLVNYGSHSQIVLPLKNWLVKSGSFDEPRNLPVINLEDWKKPVEAPASVDSFQPEQWLQARERLASIFKNLEPKANLRIRLNTA